MPVEIDVDHVARLARLSLTDEERERFRTQLGLILEHAERVREIAEDVEPTAQPLPQRNVFRDDEPWRCLIPEEALANAPERSGAIDKRFGAGEALTPAAGIPLALKDVLCTREVETTCGSHILKGYVPPYDATPWARLKESGAILVGKTNCDEFAMGSSNENSAFGPVRNPWDLETVPGGSSGGSAAAVAAGLATWALGTDTGGSVRQPGALCGVVAFKPTYGLISRYGLIAFASSLDTVGTFTRDVRDAATLLSGIAGKDPLDTTSLPEDPRDYTAGLGESIAGLRIGVLRKWLGEGVQPGVRQRVEESITRLEALGAEVGETELSHAEYALSAYYLIAPAEASSNLARYDGVRYGHRTANTENVVDLYLRTRGEGF